MFRPDRSQIPRALALLSAVMTGSTAADEPKPAEAPPVAIVVETPADFEALLKKLARPDFVIETGARFDGRRAEAASPKSPTAVVESIAVRGEVIEELAHLTIDIVASLANPGPVRLPIGLDGATVIEIREGDRFVPTFAVDGAWQVELREPGPHRLRVLALARVNPGQEGVRLELGIPQVATTALELTVGGQVTSATVGAREPVAVTSIEGGRYTRLSAHLSPRKRLELAWRVESDAQAQGSPRLTATGEIELTIDPGALRTRATWSIESERGTATNLEFGVDPADDLLGVELNGRPIPIDGLRDRTSGAIKIPLTEPLRPRTTVRLVLLTRRPLPVGGSARLSYRGTPLVDAISQSGVIVVAREGDLSVLATSARGMRQLDPLSDLRQGLRARPTTILAYQFFAQPVDLALGVEPSPPQVRVESRSRIVLGPRRATVETRLDYRVVSGSIHRVEVDVPDGLDWETAGPNDLIASSQLLHEAAIETSIPSRTLILSLSPKAREDAAFSLVLTGQCAVANSRSTTIGLFRPRSAESRGTSVVVETPLGLDAELVEGTGFVAAAGRSEDQSPESGRSRLSLRHDGDPAAIPLRIVEVPRVVRFESAISARFRRRSIDVRQETTCRVRDGSIATVDVEVPASASNAWEVEEPRIAGRRRLADSPTGAARFRLKLAKEVTESIPIRFRLRRPIEPGAGAGMPVEVPEIRILDGSGTPPSFELAAEEGVTLQPVGPGWVAADEADLGDGPPRRWSRPSTTTGPARVSVREASLASLPPIVASRLWIRTTQAPDGSIRGTAWYRIEAGGSSFAFDLPEGTTLNRAWINGDVAAEVEESAGDSYRLPLSIDPKSPTTTVCLEYYAPSGRPAARRLAPRLSGGGIVRQTFWTVRIPWNQAVVGVPTGWNEENRWAWLSYAWMRLPLRDDADLARWIAGDSAAKVPDAVDLGDAVASHAYLFSRPGDPTSLRAWIASRALLVASCSGVSLLVGLALVSWRPSPSRMTMAASAVIVAICGIVDPSVMILCVESGAIGLVLVLLAFATQRMVERPRTAPGAAFVDPAPSTPSGSSRFDSLPDVGSEESTIVRAAIGSTAEHVRPEGPEPATRTHLPRS